MTILPFCIISGKIFVAFLDKLYVVGGSDGIQSLSSAETLDLTDPNAVWRPGPPLNTPRGNVRLVTADHNRIFAVGGFSGKSFLNSIEYLEEGTRECEIVLHFVLTSSIICFRSSGMENLHIEADLSPVVPDDDRRRSNRRKSKRNFRG